MGLMAMRSAAAAMLKLWISVALLCDVAMGMLADERNRLKEEAREMFYHAYSAYMTKAYPADELMPLSCRGRFRDTEPSRGDIDDALGNFSLTLVDTMDTLVVLGDVDEFERSVGLVIRDVKFDHDIVISVFETNIRMLGGLLSGHLLASYLQHKFDKLPWYKGELLSMARDLGFRLLPAFNTSTGVPHPRINLRHGINSPKFATSRETCTACAGTMILEMAALSRLTGESIFEEKAHKAMDYLWRLRHRTSDLMGTVLNIHSGDWVRRESGVGAGIDSYYEYLLKAYILLGDDTYLERFNKHYSAVMKYISQGPMLVDVHMHRPHTNSRNFMDALLAFWPGLQVLKGDIKPAIETHEMLYQVMQRHNFLPEAFTTDFQVHWGQHLLRPEFLESTYFLHRATGDPYYLEVGKNVLNSLQKYARVPCGFAAVKDVRTGSHEDRMDSFVLAETFKYLYLLFAEKEDLLIDMDDFLFTTEAHLFPLTLARLSNATVVPKSPNMKDDDEYDEERDRICPNTNYLFPGNKDFAHSIRSSLKNLVEGVCPKQRISMPGVIEIVNGKIIKQRQLRATEFQAGNDDHLKLLKKMGISIMALLDGRVQLLHTTTHAETPEDAEEGLLFMQEMIELSESQSKQLTQQPRAVTFSVPYSDGTTHKTVLNAGPAQFGPDITSEREATGNVILADPLRCCTDLQNSASLKGKIVVMERGDCMFIDKTRRIEKAGAIAGIVIDNVAGSSSSSSPMFAMSGDGKNDVGIPVVFLFHEDATTLIDVLTQFPSTVVTLTDGNEVDSAADMTIVKESTENLKSISKGSALNNPASATSSSSSSSGSAANVKTSSLGASDIIYIKVGEKGTVQTESFKQIVNKDGTNTLVRRIGEHLDEPLSRKVEIRLEGVQIQGQQQQQQQAKTGGVGGGVGVGGGFPGIAIPTDWPSKESQHQQQQHESVISVHPTPTTIHIHSTSSDTVEETNNNNRQTDNEQQLSGSGNGKRSEIETIMTTLLNREKEYVLTLQKLLETALGDKNGIDRNTQVLLDKLGALMRPKDLPPEVKLHLYPPDGEIEGTVPPDSSVVDDDDDDDVVNAEDDLISGVNGGVEKRKRPPPPPASSTVPEIEHSSASSSSLPPTATATHNPNLPSSHQNGSQQQTRTGGAGGGGEDNSGGNGGNGSGTGGHDEL